MEHSIPLDPAGRAENPELDAAQHEGAHEIAPDLSYKRLAISNIVYYGMEGAEDRQWVLIDAGIPGTAGLISGTAAKRFGANARPAAIVMTHGHFDHIGALEQLAAEWDAPIYAHELEIPYLNGQAAYPPADPSVGGGLMALLSPLYPRGPINVSARLRMLPSDGSVPFMSGWRWIHTPGHTPGHISLWNEATRTIIAGDAFITTAQESAYAVATQKPVMHGPPMYFTPNWQDARESVRKLAALNPQLAVTGHGPAMQGDDMTRALHTLANDFDRIAVPEHGKYTAHPASAQDETAYNPVK